MRQALGWIVLAVLAHPALAHAHSKKLAVIDTYCDRLKNEFRETVPIAFSGPDPWVQIEDASTVSREEAVAYVYAYGGSIRWVVLIMIDPRGSWKQTVNYFFREDGSIAKRERYLESRASNIDFEQISYFQNGRVMKEHTHHAPLKGGREDKSKLNDPNAPVYLNTSELPFPPTPDYWRQIV